MAGRVRKFQKLSLHFYLEMNIHKSQEKIYTNQAYTVQLMVELQEKSLVFSMFISIFGGIVGMLISKKCVEILHYESDNMDNIGRTER